MPGPDDLPGWAQGFANVFVFLGALAAVLYGYFRVGSPGRAGRGEIRVAGGIIDPEAVKPLIAAIDRLAEAMERRAEQWDQREVDEARRERDKEMDALRRQIEALQEAARRSPQ